MRLTTSGIVIIPTDLLEKSSGKYNLSTPASTQFINKIHIFFALDNTSPWALDLFVSGWLLF